MKCTAGSGRPDVIKLLTVVAVISATTLAGCKNSDTPPTPTETTASPTPTKTTPASWEREYNEDELRMYREAIRRLEVYEAKSQPIWARGKATKVAKEVFQDNLMTWRLDWTKLQSYENQGIKIARRAVILNTEPEAIDILKNDAAEVALIRCVDPTDLGGTINGKPLQEVYDSPVIQKVDVFRDSDGRWRFGLFNTTEKTCAA